MIIFLWVDRSVSGRTRGARIKITITIKITIKRRRRRGEELGAGGPDFVFVVGGGVVHDFGEFGEFEEGLASGVELEFFAIEGEAFAGEGDVLFGDFEEFLFGQPTAEVVEGVRIGWSGGKLKGGVVRGMLDSRGQSVTGIRCRKGNFGEFVALHLPGVAQVKASEGVDVSGEAETDRWRFGEAVFGPGVAENGDPIVDLSLLLFGELEQ